MANDTFAELKRLYFLLDTNFDELINACKNSQEKDLLRSKYEEARDNFYRAQNSKFAEDEDDIQQLKSDLKATNDTLNKMISGLDKISATIEMIAKAVNIGTELLNKAKPV